MEWNPVSVEEGNRHTASFIRCMDASCCVAVRSSERNFFIIDNKNA